jgi:hypothetical protein
MDIAANLDVEAVCAGCRDQWKTIRNMGRNEE